MTDDFDKLLAECPPTEADRAWARAVLASPAALLQDQSRDLSRWLSDRPGARRQARVTAAAMAAAGFTARDRRLTCDECGARYTPQMAPLHKCPAA